MSKIEQHIDLLGREVKDKITDFHGTVTSVSFDLFGCIQAVVTPTVNEKMETREGRWFDVCRLHVFDTRRMVQPNFGEGPVAEGLKGGYDKPLPRG